MALVTLWSKFHKKFGSTLKYPFAITNEIFLPLAQRMLTHTYIIFRYIIYIGTSYRYKVSILWFALSTNYNLLDRGCGLGGRTVASDSRGPRFKSSHWQKFIMNIYCQLYEKTKIKKEAGNSPFCETFFYKKGSHL